MASQNHMATSSNVDLSRIVLLFSNIVGTDKILELSENRRYEFQPPEGNDHGPANWSGNQSQMLNPPFLALKFGEHMFSPQGWIVGSSDDTDKCDVQLAEDNTTGVSRQHLRFDLSPSLHCPRLTVLSMNRVQIHIDERTVSLDQGQSLDIVSPITIDLGEVTMRAWRPVLSHKEEVRYRQNVERFSEEFLDALPKLPISLEATESSTFTLRFGRNNTVYKREETGILGTGSFASVMKVKELRSKKIFAAKVPHFKSSDPASQARNRWESLTEEFRKIVELQHVSAPISCIRLQN
jgi:hypothetical protein